jgi:hypothetical protein
LEIDRPHSVSAIRDRIYETVYLVGRFQKFPDSTVTEVSQRRSLTVTVQQCPRRPAE